MGISRKKSILKLVLKRLLNPFHLFQVLRLQAGREKTKRVYDDAQLKLFHRLLPGDYLHYGYFDDPAIHPLDMSLSMIYAAQNRYAEKIIELISDKESPILDIGCGMGGLLGLMNQQKLDPIGLTPDRHQAAHNRKKYPNRLIESRFEDLDGKEFEKYFGTLVTSESLQYLNLDVALPLMDRILMKDGKWVACDYFKIGANGNKSGHNWRLFNENLAKNGFKIIHQADITPNILPTIAYAYHLAANFGVPIKDFALGKLKVKAPGFNYALEEAMPVIEEKLQKNMDAVNPAIFAANKQYMLLVIERI